jgi:hypothetical protein
MLDFETLSGHFALQEAGPVVGRVYPQGGEGNEGEEGENSGTQRYMHDSLLT